MSGKIKMIKTAQGPAGGWIAMQTYDIPADMPDSLAAEFVARGAAVWLQKPAPVVEAAVEDVQVETAEVRPKTRPRGRPKRGT
jgi:hypothetical protein